MSSRRPTSARPTDQELLSDDCNTCDLLGASAKGILSAVTKTTSNSASTGRTAAQSRARPTSTASSDQVPSNSQFWEPRPAPGIVEIGNAGWTTIHSFAAYYPDNPTEKQKQSARNLIDAFAELFPCRWCADDMKEHVAKNPVRVESRKAFSQWTCEAHNHVNEHLGKPLFDCSLFDTLWRRHQDATKHAPNTSL